MKVVTFGEMLMRLTTDPTARLQQTNQSVFIMGEQRLMLPFHLPILE